MLKRFNYEEETEDNNDYFFTEFHVNNVKYRMEFLVYVYYNSTKIYVSISSGKKRKTLNIFEDNGIKNKNGIKPLLIVKKLMYDFSEYYKKEWINYGDIFLCINWSDVRRREIYKRLEKEGFRLGKIDNTTTLFKNISKN